jgi:D-beta-D-heptose 7-phosphate kinase/D-beta-D-heptose 1-phosphate adenosyltransferase
MGEAMLDCYLNGHADRLCQEAPVPVVAVTQRQDFPGGAANVAANVSSLGAMAWLLSVVGQDEEGDRLKVALQERHTSTQHLLTISERSTLAKQRVMADNHLLVRFDLGSTEPLSPNLETYLINRLQEIFLQCDAVIVSDYHYGILTPQVIDALATLQRKFPRTVVVDSKKLPAYRGVAPTAIKPNYREAIQLLGLSKQTNLRVQQMIPHGSRLLDLTGAAIAIVTLDAEGALIFQHDQSPFHIPAQPAPTHHTSGAGDTFVSALTLALASHVPVDQAASLAAAATSTVITQVGTSVCQVEEFERSLQLRVRE